MKKAILGTTALVAVSALAVGNASAADKIKLGVTGYMQSTYYYADYDQDKGAAPTSENLERISDRVTQEGEIHFTGSTTLDNGIKFGVNVQLEAYEATDQIDETFVYVQGSFGRVLLGSEDGAAYLMHYDAPSPVPMYSADSPNIYPIGTTNSTRGTQFSDRDKITYFTPRFAGFQLGASYVPDASSETGQHSAYAPTLIEGGLDAGYSLAVNYVNKFGGVDLAVSAGYNSAEVGDTQTYTGAFAFDPATGGSTKTSTTAYTTANAAEDQTEYTLGAQVGFAGFTVGGGYRQQKDLGGVSGADKKTYSGGVK
ncbi:MAG: porin, partial [Sneathiella sp.]